MASTPSALHGPDTAPALSRFCTLYGLSQLHSVCIPPDQGAESPSHLTHAAFHTFSSTHLTPQQHHSMSCVTTPCRECPPKPEYVLPLPQKLLQLTVPGRAGRDDEGVVITPFSFLPVNLSHTYSVDLLLWTVNICCCVSFPSWTLNFSRVEFSHLSLYSLSGGAHDMVTELKTRTMLPSAQGC